MTELKRREMSSSTLIPHTNTHAVHGRLTLKDVERFRNGSVRKKKQEMFNDIKWTNGQIVNKSKMESSFSTFVPLVVNAVIFPIVVLIYIRFFVYIYFLACSTSAMFAIVHHQQNLL